MIPLPSSFINSPIIVWGTGLFYNQTKHLFDIADPIMFIDSDIIKQKNLFEGKEVKSPDFLKSYTLRSEKILVFVTVYEEIKNVLESFGLQEGEHFAFPLLYIYKNFITQLHAE